MTVRSASTPHCTRSGSGRAGAIRAGRFPATRDGTEGRSNAQPRLTLNRCTTTMSTASRSNTAPTGSAATRTADLPASNRRALLAAPALLGLAALPVPAAAASAVPSPDAALLQLGARFEAAWKAENEAWNALAEDDESSPAYHHACDLSEEADALADEIERSRAATLPGLLVKGRALRRHRGSLGAATVSMFDLRPLIRHWEPSDDQRLIVSILADLHAMTGDAT